MISGFHVLSQDQRDKHGSYLYPPAGQQMKSQEVSNIELDIELENKSH
ncbi:MAG TPA: hypothetical protein VD710_03695 [Nitrososphaeraceae archaeon]|nr:hypothetical protein [Nitrososphaeraceae archaeon]